MTQYVAQLILIGLLVNRMIFYIRTDVVRQTVRDRQIGILASFIEFFTMLILYHLAGALSQIW